MKVKIAKFLASCGVSSRRKCEELVLSGNIKVNDEVITDPATRVNPEIDKVTAFEHVVSTNEKVYYLLNKPVGYTSSVSDPHAKKLVTELVPNEPPVWPVGRLDVDTAGLLILTNDGELTQKLTHPSHEKSKTYIAKLSRELTEAEIRKLESGILLSDGPITPDKFKYLGQGAYEVTVHEGRNRLVRRMFEYFGATVTELTRVRLSFLKVDDLPNGSYRELTEIEIEGLKNA